MLYITCMWLISLSVQTDGLMEWSKWSQWSECTKTCNRGVSQRRRQCNENPNAVRSTSHLERCPGHYRQYIVCNTEKCPTPEPDYRKEQCDKFNKRRFAGKSYIWKSFIDPRDRCTISCRPVGFSFYARIVSGVPDGSICYPTSDHICVNGLCKKIGCDNIVGSGKEFDRCGVCGGRNETCNIMKGFYTPPNLPSGYNTILNLPKGACNINITETTASRNLLALKTSDGTYILNGHWRKSSPGLYKTSGTEIHYKEYAGKKCVGECIYTKGPTKDTLMLELLVYDRNPGIFYEYSIPTGMVPTILDKMKSDVSERVNPLESQRHGQRSHRNHHYPHHHQQHHRQDSEHQNFLGTKHLSNSRNINRRPGPYYIPSFDSNQALGSSSGSPNSGHKWNSNLRASRRRPYPHHQNQYSRIVSSKINDSTTGREKHLRPYLNNQGNRVSGSRYAAYRTSNRQYFSASKFYSNHTRYGNNLHKPEQRQHHSKLHLTKVHNNVPVVPNSNTGTSDQLEVTYTWNIVGFTKCSEPCGGGTQETKIVCVKTNSKTIVTDANCNPSTKLPTQTTVCNTAPCPARWAPGEWSECSLTCGEGQMTRQVECKQKYSKTFFKRVSASACLNQTRLITVKKCQNKPCSQWEIKEWSKCSVECGLGQRSRKVTCVSADGRVIPDYECRETKPSVSEVCNMGSCAKSWFFTEWSKECSSSCGHGVLRRQVHCSADDGSNLEDSKCKLSEKPKSEKSCKSDQPCGGLWFTGPWSECSATCGQAFKIRSAACVKKLHSTSFVVVSPNNCVKKDKPATKEPCLTMPACPAQWHMTEWTQCSASCGTGSKTREVKCMDSHLRHSTLCNPDKRPITRQSCDSHSCHQKPLNTDPSCQDQIKLCRLVVQARLCSYKYYQRKCCETCYKHRVHNKHHHSS
ncbi:thrombospondin type-1 domain-containing protein 4 isoform X1 [Octopus bimaculoides]|nr:thrombospondin type-1 domain-containing protein 4 isoform X1 [Octopus bimaculoides]XP_014772663.1 thrombospondin type-1 domain-containing protein 4 isoform X1 [Octopus bimaculoides]|eukprot:XP_014772662.1 PREDICTED: thrombospondin type-1 domain-containing protein 4-like isoform X1 [Octopus bimaculoides]